MPGPFLSGPLPLPAPSSPGPFQVLFWCLRLAILKITVKGSERALSSIHLLSKTFGANVSFPCQPPLADHLLNSVTALSIDGLLLALP